MSMDEGGRPGTGNRPATSEELFRVTFEHAPVGIAHVAPGGRILRVNDKLCEILGYPRDELLELSYQQITHAEDLESDVAQAERLLAGEAGVYSLEKRYRQKSGDVVWGKLTVSLIRDEQGEPALFVAVVEDVTERKLAEDRLRASEAQFRSLVEQAPIAMEIFAPDGRVVQTNAAFQELWGLSDEERDALLETYNVLEDRQTQDLRLRPWIERAFEGEVVDLPTVSYDAAETLEALRFDSTAARKRWVQTRFYPVRDPKGEIVNVVETCEDVTARKTAERALQQSEEKFRALISNIPDVTWTTDREMTTTFVSDNLREVCGIDPEEIYAHPRQLWLGRVHPEDLERVEEAFDSFFRTEQRFDVEYRLRHRDGHWIWIHDRSTSIYQQDGRQLADGVLADVSQRKRAEEALLASRHRLRKLAAEVARTGERERRAIAADLHDQVGQSLSFMRIQLATAIKRVPDGDVKAILSGVSDHLRQAVRDTRGVISDLSSPTLNELGLSAAVAEWLKVHAGDRHGLQIRFREEGDLEPMGEETKAVLYRSVRELLINVVKHAKARRVTVCLRRRQDRVEIVVEDDGVGLGEGTIPIRPMAASGFGLLSIEERMRDVGGSLEIENAPGGGVRATLAAPLKTGAPA